MVREDYSASWTLGGKWTGRCGGRKLSNGKKVSTGMTDACQRGEKSWRGSKGPRSQVGRTLLGWANGRLTLASLSVPAQARPSSQTWTPRMLPAPRAPPPPASLMTPGELWEVSPDLSLHKNHCSSQASTSHFYFVGLNCGALSAYLSPRLEDLAFCDCKSLTLGPSSSKSLGFRWGKDRHSGCYGPIPLECSSPAAEQVTSLAGWFQFWGCLTRFFYSRFLASAYHDFASPCLSDCEVPNPGF